MKTPTVQMPPKNDGDIWLPARAPINAVTRRECLWSGRVRQWRCGTSGMRLLRRLRSSWRAQTGSVNFWSVFGGGVTDSAQGLRGRGSLTNKSPRKLPDAEKRLWRGWSETVTTDSNVDRRHYLRGKRPWRFCVTSKYCYAWHGPSVPKLWKLT